MEGPQPLSGILTTGFTKLAGTIIVAYAQAVILRASCKFFAGIEAGLSRCNVLTLPAESMFDQILSLRGCSGAPSWDASTDFGRCEVCNAICWSYICTLLCEQSKKSLQRHTGKAIVARLQQFLVRTRNFFLKTCWTTRDLHDQYSTPERSFFWREDAFSLL